MIPASQKKKLKGIFSPQLHRYSDVSLMTVLQNIANYSSVRAVLSLLPEVRY